MSDEWEAYTQSPPTRPRPADGYTPHTEGLTMQKFDPTQLKEGLKRVLPVLKTVAALTPTPVDNIVVAFVEQLLAASDEQAAKMLSELK